MLVISSITLTFSCAGKIVISSEYNCCDCVEMNLLPAVKSISTSEAFGEVSHRRMNELPVLVECKENRSNEIVSEYFSYWKGKLKKINYATADSLFFSPFNKRVYLSMEYINERWSGQCDGISFVYENNTVTKIINPNS